MDKNKSAYIFGFALAICLVCSFVLTFVSQSLKEKQQLNVQLDKKKNILKVVSLKDPLSEKPTAEEILEKYKEKIEAIILDENGVVIEGKTINDIEEGDLPLYVYKERSGVVAYAFPVVGQGLWSTLYGYFSLEPDAMTVRGITFYEHGETPGLGAEIEKDWFQSNFVGKKVWDMKKNQLRPVGVVKGTVDTAIAKEGDKQYYVDGISGATITSNGVTDMLVEELDKYEPYFSKIRSRYINR